MKLYSMEFVWPPGQQAPGNPGVMMLVSTRLDQAVREAGTVCEGQAPSLTPRPTSYRIHETATSILVHESQVPDA